jgi:beta-glucosidase
MLRGLSVVGGDPLIPLLQFIREVPRTRLKYRRRESRPRLPPRSWRVPPDFLWGAASASHQVEGGNQHSDWWRYERLDGKVQAFWDFPEFARTYKSDHWRRFPEDIARMQSDLGLRSYRFSIEWSRVEPRDGEFDEVALARYAEMCALMRANGIRPMVTLFHWASPDWIWDHDRERETGWYDPAIVDRFERYVRRVVAALGSQVDVWCTMNEMNSYVYAGYAEGVHVPGHRNPDAAIAPVIRNLLRAHARAYRAIKEAYPQAQVGIAHQFTTIEPEQPWNPLAWVLAGQVENTFTWLYTDAIRDGRFALITRDLRVIREDLPEIRGTLDFVGVNYYERLLFRIPGGWNVSKATVVHDHMTAKEVWPRESHPADFLHVLRHVAKRYKLPIYVTENGRAHSDDREREAYLYDHLQVVAYAIDELKLPILGYYWWSLLDNQEWANGFVPRLGLYHVDYETGARTLRGTGRAYARIIRDGIIDPVAIAASRLRGAAEPVESAGGREAVGSA